ncbi:MAG: hypothetical protein J0H14_27140 [Alphaproteobacteria bacterium]|nr:hypothetical protein [Alphaproteobacteria bacterium]
MTATTLYDLNQDSEDFHAEAHEDYVGLWQIAARTRRGGEIDREQALRIVHMLLERGLRIGNLTSSGGFIPWSRQEPGLVIDRIRREWIALGRDPSVNDIAWFDLASS